ncbi:MAG TPA: hypothetical protein VKM54_28335 [Myxococcota bacterium]|nr:hypothetical protein [Myxococcota bacterium]
METPSAEDASKALAGAQRFLAAQGAPLDLLRLEVLLGERPCAALEQALAPLFVSTSGDACVALEVLEALADAGCLRGGLADRVAVSLQESQQPDGSWRAPGREAPPAPKPAGPPVGARDALFLTAMLGAFLGRTARSSAAALRAAGGYLAVHWSPELVQAGSWHAISGYAHFFSNVPHEISDAVLQWCGRELERAFRLGAFDAVRAARVFTLCDAHALPGAKLDAIELVPALLRAQSADGGWPAPTTPMRVSDTLWAALALVKLRPRSWRRGAR